MEGFFPTSLTPPPPYLGGAESDRAEAAMGGGEMATASAPSPASGPARMDSSQIVCVGGLDSTKCSMEWPADYSVEALALAIQEWPMNSQFDLNMDSSFQRGFLEDIVGHSSSSENPESKDEVAFDDHLEGETDVEDLFPPTPEDELDEATVDKATVRREARSKDAKAKALKIRQVKQRADACTSEDVFVLSDSCSDDNKEIINLSDDDGAVLESKIALRKRKSVAKPVKKRVYYDESKSNAHEQFVLDLCFIDITQLRKALENYHIANCRNFTYLKNNQERVVVCCSSDGTCPFMLHSSTIKGERTHCIRQIMLPHTCGTKTDTSRINSSWLAKKYEDFIKSDPSMCVTALMDAVLRDHGVEISKHMAYRAKNRALEAVVGDEDAQFTRIRDYMQTVMDKDPGSRCHVTTVQPVPEKNPRFWGLFFTLNAQIQGFLNGCSPFIGIDGCFLKLGNGAQVLAATARDGNNNMYPLAFGVVGKEDTVTWAWFLNQLKYAKKGLWQVTNMERTYEVNLEERKCGCFKWDLTGIPCKHAVRAIINAKEYPEDYVSDFFKKPLYKKAYKNLIYPVPGPHGWTKTDTPDIDPPEYETKRGRKQKKRRRGQHEASKSTTQVRMTTITCSNCKLHGHRYTNCVQPLKPHLAIRKAQHKTTRTPRGEGSAPPQASPRAAAPPQASSRAAAPPQAPSRAAAPPQAPRRPAPPHVPRQPAPPHVPRQTSAHQNSSVTGRSSGASGSNLGMQGYESTRLYSYFTAGLGYQAEANQNE